MEDFAVIAVSLGGLGGAGAGSFAVSLSCGLVLLSVVDQENRRHIVTVKSRVREDNIWGFYMFWNFWSHGQATKSPAT